MNRETIDAWAERATAILLLLAVVFGVVGLGAVRPREFAVVQFLIIAATGLWILRLVLGGVRRLLWPSVMLPLLLFVVYAGIRYWTAEVEYPARKEFVRILTYSWFFILAVNNLHRQETMRWTAAVLIGLATAEALYAVYQFIKGTDYVLWFLRPENYRGRGSGTYICPNHLAGFLEMQLPLALGLLFFGRLKDLGRVVAGYAAAASLAGVTVTLSRGGWAASAFIVAAFFGVMLRYRAQRKAVLAAIAVALLIGGGAIYKLVTLKESRFKRRIEHVMKPGHKDDASIRLRLAAAAARMWLDHPWFGVGPGHFDVYFPQYRPKQVQSRPIWAHNDYLNLLTDLGLVGGLLAGWGIGALGLGAWRTWKYVKRSKEGLTWKRSDRAALVLGFGGGLCALAIHSWVDFNLHIPANAMTAALFAAGLAAHQRFATSKVWTSAAWRVHWAMGLAGLLFAAYAAPEAIRSWREAFWTERGMQAKTLEEQIRSFQRAIEVEPKNAELVGKLGEVYRLTSWEGGDGWRWLAQEALKWFSRARELNPLDPHWWIRCGMCLDWLGRTGEADSHFAKAVELDPNSYYATMMMGWHEMQKENWSEAIRWFERSLEIKPWENWLARNYLRISTERLKEEASWGSPASKEAKNQQK